MKSNVSHEPLGSGIAPIVYYRKLIRGESVRHICMSSWSYKNEAIDT